MDILIEQVAQPHNQWSDVHLLVVTRNHDGDCPAKLLVSEQRGLGTLNQARWLLRVEEDRASQGANHRCVLQHDRQIAKKPGEPSSERRVNEVVIDREDADEADL